MTNAGIVDEDIHAAEKALRLGEKLGDGFRLADVGRQSQRLTSVLLTLSTDLSGFIGLLLIVDDNAAAICCQTQGNSLADTAAGSGY